MFSVEGHEWPIEPYMAGADMISVVEYAGSETLDIFIRGGAGGPYRQVGDFVVQCTAALHAVRTVGLSARVADRRFADSASERKWCGCTSKPKCCPSRRRFDCHEVSRHVMA